VVLYSLDRYPDAADALDRALALEAGRLDYLMLRGNTRVRLGRFDDAIADYGRCIDLDPVHAEAFYAMGMAHYNKRDYDEAITWLKRYLEIDPRSEKRPRVLDLIDLLEH
jgi:tetratricopeptide (TPR) repeat protein